MTRMTSNVSGKSIVTVPFESEVYSRIGNSFPFFGDHDN